MCFFPNWYPAAFYIKIIVHVQVLQEEAQTIGHVTDIENSQTTLQ